TPLAGLHKFYLGQPLWGLCYLLLWSTPIPRVACTIEIVWYLIQDRDDFERRFNDTESSDNFWTTLTQKENVSSERVEEIAHSLRQLDQLRQDGLMTEYEFEQKRRQLLDRIA
ncbi:MAG: hypothetical protein F6K24_40245, partial [Okeania sp. SIO2D1]|nr:hypothetical protein [Okeania sp. SIO2D1]